MTPEGLQALAEWGRSITVISTLIIIIWTGVKGVWVFRFVVEEWRQQAEDANNQWKKQAEQRHADLLTRIEELKSERDYFQGLALQSLELAKRGVSTLEATTQQQK